MWRIIDANFNRLREGLRVLEDITRFLLNNPSLFAQIREIRHGLKEPEPSLLFRDVPTDIGAEEKATRYQDLAALVRANACRCQEALRVLEECSRLPEFPLDGQRFQSARFRIYQLEKELIAALKRQEKIERLRGLYVILDSQLLAGRDELEAAQKVISGGVKVIQLRDKHREKGELLSLSSKLKELCYENGVLFIINDHLDIALLSEADGLHLGQKDIPLTLARKLLPDKIIGLSTHNLEQAKKAEAEGADYIAVGSIYATPTKKEAEVVGPGVLREIIGQVSLPVVAIGGINRYNINFLMKTGIKAVAVASAVLTAEDIEGACRQLVSLIEHELNN